MTETPMSEKEKMLAGELYNAADAELVVERRRAQLLLVRYNATGPDDPAARATLLRELFGALGDGADIQPRFSCDYGYNIELGAKAYFNVNCVVLDVARVVIGRNALFGPAVQIYTAMHPMTVAERRLGLEYGLPVDIGDDVWIGGNAVICPGVSVGSGSVVGAGSVVTRNVPPGVFAAGNPCRVVRKL